MGLINLTWLADVKKRIAELNEERKRLDAQEDRREAAFRKYQKRCIAICRQLGRLELELQREQQEKIKPLVGVPNAVQMAHREPDGNRCAYLNDVLGTVTAVRRTRATVDFDVDGGNGWDFPLEELLPADATQGFMAGASMGRPEPVETAP